MANLINFLKEYIEYRSDKIFTDKQFWKFRRKKINWNNPKTYNEKLQVYKLSKDMENLWPYVDKIEARNVVKRLVGTEILNKVYGIWDDASKIDFSSLPRKYVLKTNHGSAWYVVVKDKKNVDTANIRHNLNYWLKQNYYKYYGRERQYKLVQPKIFCEKYLEDKKGNLPDYKFFCFDGKVHFIHFTIDRFSGHKRNFYDRYWKRLPFTLGPYPSSPKRYPKPKNFGKMIEIAEKLSSELKHARVDLYNIDGKIYFGEITLTPSCGLDAFHPSKYDNFYGKLFKL